MKYNLCKMVVILPFPIQDCEHHILGSKSLPSLSFSLSVLFLECFEGDLS